MKEQKKQNKVLLRWTLAWVVSLAFLTGAENTLWNDLIFTKIGLLLNLAIGIGMIVANKNLFKTYNELQKKIQFEAMAITLGLAVVVGLTYEISFDFGNNFSEESLLEILNNCIPPTFIIGIKVIAITIIPMPPNH